MKSREEILERLVKENAEYDDVGESWNLGWADALRWVLDMKPREGCTAVE